MKKIVALILALCMVASLVACGQKADETTAAAEQTTAAAEQTTAAAATEAANALRAYEGTTINVMLENHPSSVAIKELAPQFEELTGIKVNIEVLPYEEMPEKILLGFNMGSSDYDIVMNDSLSMTSYVANDYVLSLDEFIANESVNQFVNLEDFVPTYLETMKRDGKIYGLPVYGESTFLMYRKDLFEQYNLEVPKTMEELIACAKAIYEGSNGEIAGITMRGQQGIHCLYTWSGFLWGNGGRWFDESGKMDLASPEAIEAAQTYADLLNDYGPMGYANFGWQENRLLFQEGKAAMTIDATVNGAYCEDASESSIVGKVGYAAVPAFEGATQYGGQHSLAVHPMYLSKFSQNPEAAFLFMSWAMSPDVQSQCMSIEPHSGVTSLAAMQSDAFQQLYGAFVDGMLEALAQANPNYTPQNAEAQEIINRVGAAMSEVLAGTKTAEEALTKVNQEVNTEVLK